MIAVVFLLPHLIPGFDPFRQALGTVVPWAINLLLRLSRATISARADVHHLKPDHLVLRLEGFEGPLDLLLDLARAQKVDLAKISILALVEQYLAVIEGARRVRLELAADWLVMAAWLAWLKSRLLLPDGADAEDGEQAADVLAARLRDLSAIRAAAVWLSGRPQLGHEVFARGAPEDHTEIDRSRLSLELGSLVRSYLQSMRRRRERAALSGASAHAVERAGRAAASRRVARQPAGLGQPGAVPARYDRQRARASGGTGQHAAGRPGNGAQRRRAAAAGACVRSDPGAARAKRGRGGRMTEDEALRLAEALVFASAGPVGARALSQLLPEDMDADAVIAALRERYAGRGVELAETGGGVQFRTAPDLAPLLRKVIEIPRRLPRVAMETLAIIAYHQPVTRPEIEEIRGTSLSQQTLDALLEADLIAPKGRRESPGRPTLWGTTPQFLAQFGLKDLRELPRREDLLLEPLSVVVSEPVVSERVVSEQDETGSAEAPTTGH